jgi:hypothetical protein
LGGIDSFWPQLLYRRVKSAQIYISIDLLGDVQRRLQVAAAQAIPASNGFRIVCGESWSKTVSAFLSPDAVPSEVRTKKPSGVQLAHCFVEYWHFGRHQSVDRPGFGAETAGARAGDGAAGGL